MEMFKISEGSLSNHKIRVYGCRYLFLFKSHNVGTGSENDNCVSLKLAVTTKIEPYDFIMSEGYRFSLIEDRGACGQAEEYV